MKDQQHSSIDENDMVLARAIKNLDPEISPQRDLWVGIERKILDYPQKRKNDNGHSWMPYGIAASLLIAIGSMLLNVMQMNAGQPEFVSSDQVFDQMQTEYLQVRNPMVKKFTQVNQGLDEATMTDLYHNLDILEQARNDLEMQVRTNPENRRLVEMLMRVHEQELELLKQDYSRSGRFM